MCGVLAKIDHTTLKKGRGHGLPVRALNKTIRGKRRIRLTRRLLSHKNRIVQGVAEHFLTYGRVPCLCKPNCHEIQEKCRCPMHYGTLAEWATLADGRTACRTKNREERQRT